MTLSPVPVERFGGLNLLDDQGEIGWKEAIDLLNVEFNKRGRLRSRDGFAKFTPSAAAGTIHTLSPFYTTGGTKQLIAAFGGASGAVRTYDTAGSVVASQSYASSTYASIARFAAPGSEHAYVAMSAAGAATIYRWNGTAWSTPGWSAAGGAVTPTGRHLAVTADGRLANARYNGTANGDSPSTVRFCDVTAGPPAAVVPTTWPANNFVEVAPGDGEEIMALVAWGNDLYAFKQTKFAVFYGTSTDGSGNPVFNYRLVNSQGLSPTSGGSAAYRAVCTSPNGIYFANRRGIWRTTGGPAELVSRKVDPIFTGGTDASGPSALNQAAIDQCALLWHDERLWFAYPSGSATTNDRILRYDPVLDVWSLYDLPATGMASFRIGNSEEFVFGLSGATVALNAPTGFAAADAYNLTNTNTINATKYYVVTALNAAGETTKSAEVSRIIPAKLDQPANPTKTWHSTGGSLTPGVYYYRVQAFQSSQQASAGSSFVAAQSMNLSSTMSVDLSWPAIAGATTYRVYRTVLPLGSPGAAIADNEWIDIRDFVATSFTDTGASWSAAGGGFTGPVLAGVVRLTWSAVPGATGYRVYRGTSAGAQNVYIAPGNVLTYDDTGAAGTAGTPPVSNTATTTGADIGRHSSSYTLDGGDGLTTGAAITSRYRSGFDTLGSPDMKRIHSWRMQGTGAPTLQVATDFGSLETGAAVTLGTSPAVAEGVRRYAPRGRAFSWQIGGTSAWSLNNILANLAGKRKSGEHGT